MARSSSLKLSVELKIHPAASWQSKMAKNGTKVLVGRSVIMLSSGTCLVDKRFLQSPLKFLSFLFKDSASSLPNAHVRYIIHPEMLENVPSGVLRTLQRVD